VNKDSAPLVDLLRDLSCACGLPGDEGEVRGVLRRALEPYVDEIRTDSIGNLICWKNGRWGGRGPGGSEGSADDRGGPGGGPVRVMLDAHMDEVGLLVAGYAEGGFIRFKNCGGIDPRVLPGRSVLVGRAKVPGVIGLEAVHLIEPGEREKVVPMEKLFIDIGARSREEAEAVAPLGTPVYFDTVFEHLSEKVIKGKALDDRIGCAAVAGVLMRHSYPNLIVTGVFSVQEEVGLRGAQVAAHNIDPHVALAVDGTTAADVPGVEPPKSSTHVGQGPAVTLMDGTVVAHEKVRSRLVELAEEYGVPYQFRRLTTAGTDAGGIFLQRTGIPACTVSVPCRYIHAPAAVADLDDLENTIKLIHLFLDSLDKGELQL